MEYILIKPYQYGLEKYNDKEMKMDRFKVIGLIEKKLGDKDYCRNTNCGIVTDYMCILLEEGYMQNDIDLRSIKIGKSYHIRIVLKVPLRKYTKQIMSTHCGFYPEIFEKHKTEIQIKSGDIH